METVLTDDTVYTPSENGGDLIPFLDTVELAELNRGGDAYVANLPTS